MAAADDADDCRFAHDLGDDAFGRPSEGFEGAELSNPAGDGGRGGQARNSEGSHEGSGGHPPTKIVGQAGGAGE